jgi:hypothetical protein
VECDGSAPLSAPEGRPAAVNLKTSVPAVLNPQRFFTARFLIFCDVPG